MLHTYECVYIVALLFCDHFFSLDATKHPIQLAGKNRRRVHALRAPSFDPGLYLLGLASRGGWFRGTTAGGRGYAAENGVASGKLEQTTSKNYGTSPF